jgi:3-oxoacyl-[acyl-carrier-protein] synthase II
MRPRVVITGVGVCSPIGSDPQQIARHIAEGRTGIKENGTLNGKAACWIGCVDGELDPQQHLTAGEVEGLDRTAQLAILAARQALNDAVRSSAQMPPAERVGVVLGTSHGGRSQLDQFVETGSDVEDIANAERVLVRAAHFQQTGAVADKLGIRGPVVTISNACSSSGSAIGYALALLRSGRVDLVVAGGADAFSKLTYSGFVALGAMAQGPCGPFSSTIGLTLGEAAAFVVLERLQDARGRNARVYAELLGFGSSWDAYHITEPEPTGDGIRRAAAQALQTAEVGPDHIDYVHLHGTGTRANDVAESLALKRLFASRSSLPPVSSSKAFTGHTLGASSALGLIITLVGMQRGMFPPTLNFRQPRRGCDLDYVPNQARPGTIRHFLAQSAGFGGVNAVLVGGPVDSRPASGRVDEEVVISGLGILSSIGCDLNAFAEGLRQGRCGIEPVVRFDVRSQKAKQAGLIKAFDPRSLLPGLDWRRMDLVARYAVVATYHALQDAKLGSPLPAPERIGLVVATTRGAATSFEKYLDSVRGANWGKASPLSFPNLVMSSIGGHVSKAFGIKGLASTLVAGTTAGLQALVHGYEMLRQSDGQDALVVVAADEVGGLFYRLLDRLGLLAGPDSRTGEAPAPYDPQAGGMVVGEGAAALVLERVGSARARGAQAYARVAGCGLTADATEPDPEGGWLGRAMDLALGEAGLTAADVDVAYGHGRGLPGYDGREARAWRRLLAGRGVPVCCVLGNTGVAEAASGLYSTAAAALGLRHGEAYPVATRGALPAGLAWVTGAPRPGVYRAALLAGGTDHGTNAAVVLTWPDGEGGTP